MLVEAEASGNVGGQDKLASFSGKKRERLKETAWGSAFQVMWQMEFSPIRIPQRCTEPWKTARLRYLALVGYLLFRPLLLAV